MPNFVVLFPIACHAALALFGIILICSPSSMKTFFVAFVRIGRPKFDSVIATPVYVRRKGFVLLVAAIVLMGIQLLPI